MNGYFNYKDELMHHGVLGMKWGVRRYQSYSTVPRESGKRGKEIGDAKLTRGQQRKIKRLEKSRVKQLKRIDKDEARSNKEIDKELNSISKRAEKADTKYKKISERMPDGEKKKKKLNKVAKKLASISYDSEYRKTEQAMLKEGYEKCRSIINNMSDAKVSVVFDKNNKKTEKYKSAAKAFVEHNNKVNANDTIGWMYYNGVMAPVKDGKGLKRTALNYSAEKRGLKNKVIGNLSYTYAVREAVNKSRKIQ